MEGKIIEMLIGTYGIIRVLSRLQLWLKNRGRMISPKRVLLRADVLSYLIVILGLSHGNIRDNGQSSHHSCTITC